MSRLIIPVSDVCCLLSTCMLTLRLFFLFPSFSSMLIFILHVLWPSRPFSCVTLSSFAPLSPSLAVVPWPTLSYDRRVIIHGGPSKKKNQYNSDMLTNNRSRRTILMQSVRTKPRSTERSPKASSLKPSMTCRILRFESSLTAVLTTTPKLDPLLRHCSTRSF